MRCICQYRGSSSELTISRSPEEAGEYVKTLQALLRSVASSDGNMEQVTFSPFPQFALLVTVLQGSLRCDVNISVNRQGEPAGTRCEIKNLNSVKNAQIAVSEWVQPPQIFEPFPTKISRSF